MALSGDFVLTQTFEDIRDEVLERLQLIGDGESVTSSMTAKIKKTTNLLIKDWESQGSNLWVKTEGTLFLAVGQSKYDFGDADTHLTNTFFETDISVAASATDTTITVTDDEDITNGDTIGVLTDDNDLFWTTVNGVPAANVVTLTDALPLDVVVGAVVYNFNDTFIPVRRINDVRRRESTDYEIPIEFESRADYFNLPNKNQNGTPIQAYFSRQEPDGIMYIWTSPSSATPVLNFTYERKRQIISSDTDNFDMPSYWFEALVMNIAARVSYKFDTAPDVAQMIKIDAELTLNRALSFDTAVYPIELKVQQYG